MAESDKQQGDVESYRREVENISEYFHKACELGDSVGKISVALIWRRLQVTPELAAILVRAMERAGYITHEDWGPHDILVDSLQKVKWKPTRVYLDIDGVLMANDETPANYANEFIQYCVANYPTYWLTTHCRGDASVPVGRFAKYFEPATADAMKMILPTDWDEAKTEAIDFSSPFLWFDDDCFVNEREALKKHDVFDNWIELALHKDENQLRKILDNFPIPIDLVA